MTQAAKRIARTQTTARRPHETFAQRIGALPWEDIAADLDTRGLAATGPILTEEECAELIGLYGESARFRSRVVMQRHGFGQGEYQYFAYPLPPLVEALRTASYPFLVAVARRWAKQLSIVGSFPDHLADYLERCRQAGQTRPTPLMLKYEAGDYNRLHQDLYGDLAFPLQMTVLLSVPGRHFTGGENVFVEQRPRMQSRPEVVQLGQGEAVVFNVNQRPVQGSRGAYRVALRHGVSRVREGRRFALGIIFHDAA